ncbi:4603_t:CDS:1, partial [Entrophospora sp. SA101]
MNSKSEHSKQRGHNYQQKLQQQKVMSSTGPIDQKTLETTTPPFNLNKHN